MSAPSLASRSSLVTIRTWPDRQVDTSIADVILGRGCLSDEERLVWSTGGRKIPAELLDKLPESNIDPSSSEEEGLECPADDSTGSNDQEMKKEQKISTNLIVCNDKKELGLCRRCQGALDSSSNREKNPEFEETEEREKFIIRAKHQTANDSSDSPHRRQFECPNKKHGREDVSSRYGDNVNSIDVENVSRMRGFDAKPKVFDKRFSLPPEFSSDVRRPTRQLQQRSYDAEAFAVMEQFDKSLEETEEDVFRSGNTQLNPTAVETSQKPYFPNSQIHQLDVGRVGFPRNENTPPMDRGDLANYDYAPSRKALDSIAFASHNRENTKNARTTKIIGVKYHRKVSSENYEKQRKLHHQKNPDENAFYCVQTSPDNNYLIEETFNKNNTFREMAVDVGDLEKNLAEKKKRFCQGEKKINRRLKIQDKEEKSSKILNNQKQINGVSAPEKIDPVSSDDVEIGQSPPHPALDGAVIGAECNLSDPRAAVHHQGHFVVVAIDFGTTFSGYAFSFTRDPENIHMMRKWEGGDPGVINQKTPTCLLLTPDGKFHSFGYSARDNYHDLDFQAAKHWLYFDKFKMTLHHNTSLNRETVIYATNGQSLPAIVVFAHALNYFKNHALMELSDQSATEILNEDVRWVITVPAIWRQPAKQFMRQAAYEAAIATPEYPDQLLIALEPEAASIYCRKLRMNQLVPEGPELPRFSLIPQPPPVDNPHPAVEDINQGTCYIVVDCGGGTVDITVHEMMDKSGGALKELYKATGGPYGSVGVDREFERLLNEIFGVDFINDFKRKHPTSYIDLMIAFEARKRNASPFKENPLNISLPFSFIDYYRKSKGNVESAIKKYGVKGIQWSSQGMLRLSPDIMYRLFKPTVENIVRHIQTVVSSVVNRKLSYLFLVGGFAESQILQQEIRQNFGPPMRIIIPQGVSLAILRGAVLYGLDPTVVCIRRSRMTYGVGVLNRFIPGIHPRSKLITRDGQEWCADIFDKFVLTDQSVGLGDTILRSYTPANSQQKQIILNIYCSENDQAKFVTDPGVRQCGTLRLDISSANDFNSPASTRREIQTRMIFGDTEIKISALDVATQKFVRAEIDFLNM